MSEKQETIPDILQELRGYAHGFQNFMRLPMTFGTFRQYINRIDAAAKRVACKMNALQRDLWQGKKMGEFAFALALADFESALSAPKRPASTTTPETEVHP